MYFEFVRPYSIMSSSLRFIPLWIDFSVFFTAMALYLATWAVPSDFQQGETYRIIYIHVPAAWMSLFMYATITITSILFLLTKHPIFHLFTQTGSKAGTLFTVLTLVTGCFWGKPMWGAFWVWDARLTSVLILLFIYLGALCFHEISAEMASLFICIGCINIPIIKFSVHWWNTLHQPSSISQFSSSIHISMLIPILLMFISFGFICLILICIDIRQIILHYSTISLNKQTNH